MSDLENLKVVDAFKLRLDQFIRSSVEKLSFDRAQYDIDVSTDSDGVSKYTIVLQISDHGKQVVQVTPRQEGFSIDFQVIEKGNKTLPQFLVAMFHEELLGKYLDNSPPPLKEDLTPDTTAE